MADSPQLKHLTEAELVALEAMKETERWKFIESERFALTKETKRSLEKTGDLFSFLYCLIVRRKESFASCMDRKMMLDLVANKDKRLGVAALDHWKKEGVFSPTTQEEILQIERKNLTKEQRKKKPKKFDSKVLKTFIDLTEGKLGTSFWERALEIDPLLIVTMFKRNESTTLEGLEYVIPRKGSFELSELFKKEEIPKERLDVVYEKEKLSSSVGEEIKVKKKVAL